MGEKLESWQAVGNGDVVYPGCPRIPKGEGRSEETRLQAHKIFGNIAGIELRCHRGRTDSTNP